MLLVSLRVRLSKSSLSHCVLSRCVGLIPRQAVHPKLIDFVLLHSRVIEGN